MVLLLELLRNPGGVEFGGIDHDIGLERHCGGLLDIGSPKSVSYVGKNWHKWFTFPTGGTPLTLYQWTREELWWGKYT